MQRTSPRSSKKLDKVDSAPNDNRLIEAWHIDVDEDSSRPSAFISEWKAAGMNQREDQPIYSFGPAQSLDVIAADQSISRLMPKNLIQLSEKQYQSRQT